MNGCDISALCYRTAAPSVDWWRLQSSSWHHVASLNFLLNRSGITEGPYLFSRVGLFGVKGSVADGRIFFYYFPFFLPNESGISHLRLL